MKKEKTEQPYSVDGMFLKLGAYLIRDFQANLNNPSFYSDHLNSIIRGDFDGIRKVRHDCNSGDDPYLFKCGYQLDTMFKRYRFEAEADGEEELIRDSINDFVHTQLRLAEFNNFDDLSDVTRKVVTRAQRYLAQVLGSYSLDEHVDLCAFGSRATTGVPLRNACEAARWEFPISGSADHITWFALQMCMDAPAMKYMQERKADTGHNGSIFQVIDSLKLTLVPKTFKSLRGIMPNTTLGSYYSSGLGAMLKKRLKAAGYDISNLQRLHGILARTGSNSEHLITVDQSKASDNIAVSLVKLLLPTDWFEALNFGRITVAELPNKMRVEMKTFCTMGVGFTFPLQTLIFLSLLKGIDSVFYGSSSRISVYGDDVICSAHLYRHIEWIFPRLGLMINVDKTFINGKFRESCGSDYFAGVDVRPFQPKNGSENLVDKITYESVLYKFINGLRRRWDDVELRGTLSYLLSELALVTRGSILRVPDDFPDESGIKCSDLNELLGHCALKFFAPIKVQRHGIYRFKYLRTNPQLVPEKCHWPYLRRALSGNSIENYWDPSNRSDVECQKLKNLALRITAEDDPSSSEPPTQLLWRKARRNPLTVRLTSGRREKRKESFIGRPLSSRLKRQSGVTSKFSQRSCRAGYSSQW